MLSKALQRNVRVFASVTVILMGASLYFLGSQPFASGLFPSPWDKLAHVTTFALIGGATGLASGARGWRLVLSCVAGALAIGAMDELHQAYLPGRSASWADLGADLVGGLFGAVVARLAQHTIDRQSDGQNPRHR